MITINLEAMAKQYAVYHPGMNARQQECTLELMKEACKRTLELAAKNAKTYTDSCEDVWVNKQSILDTINQIQ